MSDLTIPEIKARYSKAEVGADIINKFYVPLLSNCSRYDRITGYFSSSILSAASIGFSEFCKKENPKMRMIVGVQLYEKDVNVIENPNEEELIELLSDILEKKLDETLDSPNFEKSTPGTFGKVPLTGSFPPRIDFTKALTSSCIIRFLRPDPLTSSQIFSRESL